MGKIPPQFLKKSKRVPKQTSKSTSTSYGSSAATSAAGAHQRHLTKVGKNSRKRGMPFTASNA
jgi:hypothetical protein